MSRPLIGQWILTKVFQLDYIVVINKLHPFPLLIDLHFFLTFGQQGTFVTLFMGHFTPFYHPRPIEQLCTTYSTASSLTRLQLTRLMGP